VRYAFTIMELMVSSVLIVLITLFLYSAIGSMTLSNKTLSQHDDVDQNKSKLFQLLYRDLLQAVSIESTETKDRHFHVVKLQTSNSLHEIDMPYVTYFVHTVENRLIRLEAAQEIDLPISYESRYAVHADVLSTDVSDFNLYLAKNVTVASDEDNTTADSNQTLSSSHLLYVNSKKWKIPLILEEAI